MTGIFEELKRKTPPFKKRRNDNITVKRSAR